MSDILLLHCTSPANLGDEWIGIMVALSSNNLVSQSSVRNSAPENASGSFPKWKCKAFHRQIQHWDHPTTGKLLARQIEIASSKAETTSQITISRGNTLKMPLKSESNSANWYHERESNVWVLKQQSAIENIEPFNAARIQSPPWHQSTNRLQITLSLVKHTNIIAFGRHNSTFIADWHQKSKPQRQSCWTVFCLWASDRRERSFNYDCSLSWIRFVPLTFYNCPEYGFGSSSSDRTLVELERVF